MWFIVDKAVSEAAEEIKSDGSDRAVGIVAASIVEEYLATAIRSRLRKNETVSNELFRPSGPLGSFSSKIHLGLLMGLYGDEMYRDLQRIKDVRNSFAHKLTIKEFNNQKIRDIIKNIEIRHNFKVRAADKKDRKLFKEFIVFETLDEKDRSYTKRKFIQACQMLTLILAGFAPKGRPRPPKF